MTWQAHSPSLSLRSLSLAQLSLIMLWLSSFLCAVRAAPNSAFGSRLDTRDAQDPSNFLDVFDAAVNSSAPFSLEEVVLQWAHQSGLDLSESSPAVPLVASSQNSKKLDVRGVEAERQDASNPWVKLALERGDATYKGSYAKLVTGLTTVAKVVAINAQPELCLQVSRSIIDTCKKGVRSQVAACKQSQRDSIAQCKDQVGRDIDRCKKRNRFNLGTCEAQRPAKLGRCEIARIDIPFCEFDRLTATCCEGTRQQAQALCSAGLSPMEIQKQVQSVQAKCSIATGLAKVAVKAYLSSQVVDILSQVEAVKQIGEGVAIIKKLETTRSQYERWADGLVAAAEGRIQEAQGALVSLSSQITPEISKGIAWAEAAQAAVTRNVDAFLAKASSAAAELEVINKVKDTIDTLKAVSDDINAIRAAAEKCRILPYSVRPDQFPTFNDVRSAEEVDRAVAAYEKSIATLLARAARCQAVLTRTARVLAA